MDVKYLLLLMSLAFTVAACASTPRVEARSVSSNARIAVEVEQNTVLAPGLEDDVAANLRKMIIESRSGVPTTERDNADLVVRFVIQDVNFTHATKWDWQLIDASSGAIVLSDTDTAAFGKSGEELAAGMVGQLAKIDTAAYAPESAPAARAAAPAATAVKADKADKAVQPAAPSSKTDGANAWAVVVGIESYRESLADASGAAADARAFAQYARKTLNVPEANIKLLIGERASRADMTAALMEWLPRNAVEPGGKVYVFFSGHGAPDVENGSAYLLPYDANPTYIKSGGVRVSALQESLSNLEGQQTYLFLDACFSGSGERSVLPEGTRPVVPVKELEPSASVVTFSAAGADQTTGAHKQSGHGLFTYHLLQGLGGHADADQDGDVTIGELEAHVVDAVRVDARRQNRDQTPVAAFPKSVDDKHILVRSLEAAGQ
jgi:hypothetical protein